MREGREREREREKEKKRGSEYVHIKRESDTV